MFCMVVAYSAGAQSPPRLIMARGELLAESRRLVREGNVHVLPAYSALVRTADSVLLVPPLTVMQKGKIPPSGDKHDYMSFAPYWWPDSTKPGGLPYIQRDGLMNPQTRIDHDGLRLQRTIDAAQILALAWYFTGEKKYIDRAVTLMRVFFIAPATRMNPNLNFAQAIPGVSEGRGIGIIDTRHMAQLVDAARILETYPGWTQNDRTAFRSWARRYLTWLRTSKNGREEQSQANNHGTWYDAQVAALAFFVGDTKLARSVIGTSARRRIESQINADGSQPAELARTRPMHYSLFNLDAFTQLAEMSRHVGVDFWRYTSPRGGNLLKALQFLAPYSYTDRKWPKADVAPVAADVVFTPFRRASATYTDSALEGTAERANQAGNVPQWWRLFYPGITAPSAANRKALFDRSLALARSKLRLSATQLDPANGYPRFAGVNGAWELRPASLWTSGFFAGTLWYMYQSTDEAQWRSLAERWTTGLEPLKSVKTTHDLGFMIFNSFGHGFLVTGNRHYRDVVLEASRSLLTRYNPRVGAIKSWDTEGANDARSTWKYPVIVDNLMNLEMLFWASQHGGDPSWRSIAERHALTSARVHLRADGSTAHVALFDPASGALERTTTWQGYSDSSVWARGQAWAIYGFTTTHKYTGNPELLRAAQRTADWFIAHLPPDGVPWWDMRHPGIPNVERDASAATIAASALLDLARRVPPEQARRYRAVAERILATLSTQYVDHRSGSGAILQHAVGGRPQGSEIDVGLVYADYYFVEALLRERGVWRLSDSRNVR
jgi:unsaturated chondroitin disaccharide hydrolase